jgi:hypothetical protein
MGVMPARSKFLTSQGLVERVGVEGAASYGAGISALLRPGCRRGGAADPVGSAAGREVGPARRVPRHPAGTGRAIHSGQGSRDRRSAVISPLNLTSALAKLLHLVRCDRPHERPHRRVRAARRGGASAARLAIAAAISSKVSATGSGATFLGNRLPP